MYYTANSGVGVSFHLGSTFPNSIMQKGDHHVCLGIRKNDYVSCVSVIGGEGYVTHLDNPLLPRVPRKSVMHYGMGISFN